MTQTQGWFIIGVLFWIEADLERNIKGAGRGAGLVSLFFGTVFILAGFWNLA